MNNVSYTILGKVTRGDGYGKKLGFPTANLDREDYEKRRMDVPLGVYAGTVEILASHSQEKGRLYRAGIVIGPLDANGLPKIEAHLLDFSKDIYDKRVQFSLLEFLRPFEIFGDENSLKKQIFMDLETVRKTSTLE